jgi:hypothetical protein
MKGDGKSAVQTRLKQAKIDVGICHETLASLTARAHGERAGAAGERAQRDALFEGRAADAPQIALGKSADQRTRLATAGERLEGASERIKESRRVARETEMVGADIMLDLRQQRETLLHARDGVGEVHALPPGRMIR